MPVDFIMLDIDSTGAIIDLKEDNIKFQFPLKKGMEHFPRKRIKPPYESIMTATYGTKTKDDNT